MSDLRNRTGEFTAPPQDRLILALEEAALTFERRDLFLTDDDLLDIADDWTTSRRDPDPDSGESFFDGNDADYRVLTRTLDKFIGKWLRARYPNLDWRANDDRHRCGSADDPLRMGPA